MRGNLIKPRNWTGDKSHPLWRELRFAMPGHTADDLACGLKASFNGAAGTVVDSYGLGINQGSTNAYLSYSPVAATSDPIWHRAGVMSGPITVMAVHTPTSTAQAGLLVYAQSGSSNTPFALLWSFGSNQKYSFWNDNNGNGPVAAATSALNAPHVAIARRLGGQTASPTINLWVDGSQAANSTNVAEDPLNPSADSNGLLTINRFGGFSGYYGAGTIHAVYAWSRVLSDGECNALTDDPWCMFRRPEPRSFVLWTGGIAGTPPTDVALNVTASSQVALGRNRIQGLPPDAIAAATNLSGSVADIDEDPDSPDASWLTATSATTATDVRVTFPTPEAAPEGVQNFRLLLRKTTGAPNPAVTVELRQNNVLRSTLLTGTSISSTAGTVVQGDWNATDLVTVLDGSDVECRAVSVAGVSADAPGALPAYSSAGSVLSLATMPGTNDVNVPAHAAGDLLLLVVLMRNTNNNGALDTINTGGWTQLGGVGTEYGGAQNARMGIGWKIGDGAETVVSITTSGGTTTDRLVARVYSFTAADGFATTAVANVSTEVASGTTATTTIGMPTVNPGGALNRLAVACYASNVSATIGAATGESGGNWTEPVAESAATNGSIGIQVSDQSGGGTISGGTASVTSSQWVSIGFTLDPATVAGSAVNTVEVGAIEWNVQYAISGAIARTISAVATATVGVSKSAAKGIAATVSAAISSIKQTGKKPAVSPSSTVSRSQTVNKKAAITGSSSVTAAAALSFLRVLSVAVTTAITTTIVRGLVKGLAVSSSAAVSATKVPAKALVATIATAIAAVKQTGKTSAVTSATTVAIQATKSVLRILAVTATGTVATAKAVAKALPLSPVAAVTASLARTLLRFLSPVGSSSVSWLKGVGKAPAFSSSATISSIKEIGKRAAVASSGAVSAIANKSVLRNLTIAAATTVVAIKSMPKQFSAIASAAVATVSTIAKKPSLFAATSVVAVKGAQLRKAISSATTVVAQATKSVLRIISFTVATTASAKKSAIKLIALDIPAVVSSVKSVAKKLAIVSAGAVIAARLVAKKATVTAASLVAAAASHAFVRNIVATVVTTVALSRNYGRIIAVVSAAYVAVVNDVAKSVATTVAAAAFSIKEVRKVFASSSTSAVLVYAFKPVLVAALATVESAVAVAKHPEKMIAVATSAIVSIAQQVTRVARDIFTLAFQTIASAGLFTGAEAAVDAIMTDESFGRDALYRSGGLGPGVPLRVIPLNQSDQLASQLGDAWQSMTSPGGRVFRVKTTDFEASGPKTGDTLEVDGRLWRVRVARELNPLALIWDVECGPVAS